MNEKNTHGKAAVIVIILLFICISVSPSTIGIQECKKSETTVSDSEEFNLWVSIKPTRHILPRVYDPVLNFIGFDARVMNDGPGTSSPGKLTFEIIKIVGKEPGEIYNETFTFDSQPEDQGRGYMIPWASWIHGRFGIFVARATINVDDMSLKDNTKSFYFIMIHVN